MRIVVFTTHYPPLSNPRAFRIGNFLKSNIEIKDILVITSPVKGYVEKDKRIIRCGLRMYIEPQFRNSIKKYSFIRFLHKLCWPDDKLVHQFLYFMYYLLKYRKKEDIIITVSNPFSSHLIGLILKKFGKHPWKMDIGDIYYGNQHHSWLSKWFERIILNSADHIVVNAESLRNHFLTLYRLLQEKITVIPNGVHIDLSKINKTKSDTIRLSYIGNTYQDIREGIPELELLRKMVTLDNSNKYQIQLYGTQYFKVSEWSERHPGFISISHCKNEEELIQAYSNTDILVNFAHRNNPGLPSKLEEYVASGLPIINFYYTEQDPSYVFLNTNTSIAYHCNLNAPNIQALQTFIELTRDSDLINK